MVHAVGIEHQAPEWARPPSEESDILLERDIRVQDDRENGGSPATEKLEPDVLAQDKGEDVGEGDDESIDENEGSSDDRFPFLQHVFPLPNSPLAEPRLS